MPGHISPSIRVHSRVKSGIYLQHAIAHKNTRCNMHAYARSHIQMHANISADTQACMRTLLAEAGPHGAISLTQCHHKAKIQPRYHCEAHEGNARIADLLRKQVSCEFGICQIQHHTSSPHLQGCACYQHSNPCPPEATEHALTIACQAWPRF